MNKKTVHRLGYVAGVVIAAGLALIGKLVIETDNDLIFALVGSILVMIVLGIIQFSEERNRFTRREAKKIELPETFNKMGPLEQKCYQLIWIILGTDLILVLWVKGERILLTLLKFHPMNS
jgi:hypothetical protein